MRGSDHNTTGEAGADAPRYVITRDLHTADEIPAERSVLLDPQGWCAIVFWSEVVPGANGPNWLMPQPKTRDRGVQTRKAVHNVGSRSDHKE